MTRRAVIAGTLIAAGGVIAACGVPPLLVGAVLLAEPLLNEYGVHFHDFTVNGEPVEKVQSLLITLGTGIALVAIGGGLAAWGVSLWPSSEHRAR